MLAPLWQPTLASCQSTDLYAFQQSLGFPTYEALYEWSIQDVGGFWSALWDFCKVIGNKGSTLLENPGDVANATFFPQGELNYAENLLQRQDDALALYSYREDHTYTTLTFRELYAAVSQWAQQLEAWGLQPGDCVAGYLPNIAQTVVATLATSTLGGVWACCSPDFGTSSVIDRLAQVEPKVLFTVDGYYYNGKLHNVLERLPAIVEAMPSVEHVVVIPFAGLAANHSYENWHKAQQAFTPGPIGFKRLPFNHPLFILFSSGTTGKPKCIVHGAGGTLLQHLKEHRLHSNIKQGDRVFYYTTCGWMMWNWLISGLATQASVVLYDGNPTFPALDSLWDIVEGTQATFFGTSAKYLSTLQKADWQPHQNLSALRTIASTGSPLWRDTFAYVYSHIKSDVHLASISGGTDIVSCFMLGNPARPVHAGQLQGAGLGMAVDVWDDNGHPVPTGQQGELVCTKPFVSRPIGFWNDPTHERYHSAYYSRFAHVWHHGDVVERTPEDGYIVHGRSDSVLNPGGVRIGTAEIYYHVAKIPQVLESIAIGQRWEDDIRVILFVTLKAGDMLTPALIDSIKNQIRTGATPRHVPAKIIQVADLPRTRSGKLSEAAMRQAVHNEPIKNHEALANPECLEGISSLEALNS